MFGAQRAWMTRKAGQGVTVLRLNMDGANNSTIITDTSASAHTMTCVNNAKLSTAQAASGSSSLLVNGAGDRLTTPASVDFSFGTGNFKIKMALHPTAAASYGSVVATNNTGSAQTGTWWLEFNATRGIAMILEGTTYAIAYAITNNAWYNLEASRVGGVLKFFVNGLQIGTDMASSQNLNVAQLLSIGALGNGAQSFIGYIDDVIIETANLA